MGFTIRAANIGDSGNILDIYTPYILNTTVTFEIDVPSIEDFTGRVAGIIEHYPYFVCVDDVNGEMAGYAYANRHGERAAYRYGVDVSVYVRDKYQRLGIGKLLYTRLLGQLVERGFYTAYAGIALPNKGSVALHTLLGFKSVGVYHNAGYKLGKWLDIMWLEKQLKEYGDPLVDNQ